jgi:predicted NBD/HSP70 family sugar kinase
MGRHLNGCRIGFDLGGSDRKAAALIDGEIVFSEEIAWDPYFQKDPAYHIEGVHDSLKRAAAHLPRVDAIGGSAAGVYVNNEVRVGSLFRGVPPVAFEAHIRRMFFTLQERWGGVPFEVVNDGEVTALAGSMAMNDNAVLGVSMGTSQAGGYVTPAGNITSWLNELAFAPVDYRADAPRDEWSGDRGCGVQYFSQQGVGRLAAVAGFGFPSTLPLPEQLIAVQDAMKAGDARARAIYETIGICFGYSIAHYADFYELRNLLVLGRVSSGEGGDLILARAQAVLRDEFPALAETIRLRTPDEKSKRHGQATAAASLPATPSVSR